MGVLPLAFSASHFVNSVGAKVGFASLIGLALLVLLFFAQARETSSLRRHAEELMARIGELEARLTRLHNQVMEPPRAAVAPAPPPPARPKAPATVPAAWGAPGAGEDTVLVPAGSAAGELTALEMPPAPPAGVGAPALASATRVVPAGMAIHAAAARVPAGVAASTAAPAAPVGPAAPGGPSAPTGPATPPVAPATVAGSAAAAPPRPANGSPPTRVAPPPRAVRPPARPAAAPVRAGVPAGVGAGGGSVATARRAPSRPATFAGERTLDGRGGSPVGRAVLVGLAGLIIAGGVAVAVVLSRSGSGPKATHRSPLAGAGRSSGRQGAAGGSAVNPATVTVAVLNGTTTNRLAERVANRLVADGFRKGLIGNTAAPNQTSTVVSYMDNDKAAALAVARALRLGSSTVAPVDNTTRVIACSNSTTCTANVVVTVGANYTAQ